MGPPHIAHAARVSASRGTVPGRRHAPMLGAIAAPAMVVDARARVVDMNASAERLVARGAIRLEQRVIAASSPACTRCLHDAIRDALAMAAGTALPRPTRVRVSEGLPEAMIVPMQRSEERSTPCVLVLFDEDANDPLHGLSARQREVAALLGIGLTIDEAARHLDIGAHTVRSHLKEIYRRLGIASRAELARRVG